MDRRSFFRSLAVAPLVVPAAAAALKAPEVSIGNSAPVLTEPPPVALQTSIAQTTAQLLANLIGMEISFRIAYECGGYRSICSHFCTQLGDTVNIPTMERSGKCGLRLGNMRAILSRHFEANFQVKDITRLLREPFYYGESESAITALSEAVIGYHREFGGLLVTSTHPHHSRKGFCMATTEIDPSDRWQQGNIPVRVIMSYLPTTLAPQFSVDLLVGSTSDKAREDALKTYEAAVAKTRNRIRSLEANIYAQSI
jgi:hypothetical protein